MEQVNFLSAFFNAIAGDPRISITHIGIYAALLKHWGEKHFENPVQAFSHEVMKTAKISASTTYHRTIRDLHHYGYIRYEPSFKRNKASRVYIVITFPDQPTQLNREVWKSKS